MAAPPSYQEYAPPEGLRGLVRALWSVEDDHAPDQEAHRFMPERSVRLTFYAGESYFDLGGQLVPLPPAYLLGLHGRAVMAFSRGRTRVLGADLYPWGAVQLLGLHSGVQALHYPLREPTLLRLGRDIRALLEAGDLGAALGELQAWLTARAIREAREPGAAVQAAARIYRDPGPVNIAALAETVGLSPRSLERRFQAEIGVPPKALARLIRFEEAHNRMWTDPARSLTDLAYDLGYADQAHFTRDFHGFAGISPSAFLGYVRGVREQQVQQDAV